MNTEQIIPESGIIVRSIGAYARHWAIVDAYAQEEGFNLSLALRKIIDWFAQTHPSVAEPPDNGDAK